MSHRIISTWRTLTAAALLLVSHAAFLAAQPTPSVRPKEGETIVKKADGAGASATVRDLPPVERAIDPAHYRLGPNDQLVLSLPIIEAGDYPLVVALDNTLLLPRGFPLIDVHAMTLARLRDVVDSMFRNRSASYRNVNVALVKPRSIYVTVSGDVLFPDRYVVTAADRATTVIDFANRVSSEGLTKQRELEIDEQRRRLRDDRVGSRDFGENRVENRWVTLRHNDGTIERLDLMRYRALGGERDNPTLMEGDEVIVHGADRTQSTTAVVGAVNRPMLVPYSDGDNALMLMRLSGGLRIDADRANIYISRRTAAGLTKIQLDPDDTAALASTPVMAGDQLMVLANEPAVAGASRSGVVSVVGEVGRPAAYPIIPGVTTLSEVIRMAGGVRPEAALNGAYITRSIDERYQVPIERLAREPGAVLSTSSLALDDTTRLKYDIENQKNRVSADFVEVIGRGNTSRDVPLESGDEIVIPPSPKNVFVRGRVANPGWVAYATGADFDYYITKAGGFTDAAVPGRAQVRKYGTGAWLEPAKAQIMSGDEIYVPGERDLPGRTALEVASSYIAIAGGLASLAFTLFSIYRDLTK